MIAKPTVEEMTQLTADYAAIAQRLMKVAPTDDVSNLANHPLTLLSVFEGYAESIVLIDRWFEPSSVTKVSVAKRLAIVGLRNFLKASLDPLESHFLKDDAYGFAETLFNKLCAKRNAYTPLKQTGVELPSSFFNYKLKGKTNNEDGLHRQQLPTMQLDD